MPSSEWNVGPFESIIEFGKTDAQVADLLEWLIIDLEPPDGLTQAELNQWKLNEAHKCGMQAVMRKIRENQIRVISAEKYAKYRQEQQDAIAAALNSSSILDGDDEVLVPPMPD